MKPDTIEKYTNQILLGDCLDLIQEIPQESVDLVYVDPPFFTQKTHEGKRKDNGREASFNDIWASAKSYYQWLHARVSALYELLKIDGGIFIHCDWHASHWIRLILDDIFGESNFRNEIIWSYRRWTLATKHLQRTHDTIFFYAKSDATEINTLYEDYSPTTNLDQIWQKRTRDEEGKSVYASDQGEAIAHGEAKKGVPLRDVWTDIPYLNPKAKERVGYPTQKPVELLERVIRLASDENDIIVDPMVGSGTTVVAAQILNRKYIGIDVSEEAVEVTKKRLANPVISRSAVTAHGRKAFEEKVNEANADLMYLLDILDAHPVYRNRNIDGFLRKSIIEEPVAVRIVGAIENSTEAYHGFVQAVKKTKSGAGLFIEDDTNPRQAFLDFVTPADGPLIIRASVSEIEKEASQVLEKFRKNAPRSC